MSDFCLKFETEIEAQQVLTACGLVTVVPEHTETVAAHSEERQEHVDDATLETELNATAPQAPPWTRIVLRGETYMCIVETDVDEYGNEVGEYRSWYRITEEPVPEIIRTVPASLAAAPGVCIAVVGVIHRQIGEPAPDANTPPEFELLPGWHVNVLLCGDVPEPLQPYIVTPTRRLRVWAGV